MSNDRHRRQFVTLGMFIVDEFSFADENGEPTGKTQAPEIGGGGTYAAIGARIWLDSSNIGMIVDRGNDFPTSIQQKLDTYGSDTWLFRDHADRSTTKALNSYKGDHRGFEYITPRLRLTPRDFKGTKLDRSEIIHFICSPTRASEIISEVDLIQGWSPTTIFEPIPDRCVPEELPALLKVLPSISILSPNAEEALSLLSMRIPPTKLSVEEAAKTFFELKHQQGSVIIRSGSLGAYIVTLHSSFWVDAYWTSSDSHRVVDVTGAGNAFLGGLAAGLSLSGQNVYEATLYATVSASFVIEQGGLPSISGDLWNGELPQDRLQHLRNRVV